MSAESCSKRDSLEPTANVNGFNKHERLPWTAEQEDVVLEPYKFIETIPGKGFRSKLMTGLNALLNIPKKSFEVISRTVSSLHTASLLIDDIQDGSDLRRGLPAAHLVYGSAQAINAANYVYFCVMQDLLSLHNPRLMEIFLEEIVNAHRGQGMDLYWRDSLICPTVAEYSSMVQDKTGALFRVAFRLMEAESDSPPAPESRQMLLDLINTMSVLFQVSDDYKNLWSTEYESKKGFAEDLTEGKLSLPVIHAIQTDTSCHLLQNVLKQRSKNGEMKRHAIRYMEEKGSLKFTREIIQELTERCSEMLTELVKGNGGQGDILWQGLRRVVEDLMLGPE